MNDVPSKLGPFEVVRMIGAGGMGEVFLARDPRLGREVAIKVLPADLTEDPDRRSRFLREARAAAALNHPNITTIHEIGEVEGRDYIAFELVEGKTLQQLVAERDLPMSELVDLALPLADALAYAHEQGVVHRDLKVANVMVTPRGLPKLLDFGLAKVNQEESADAGKKQSTTLTVTGAVFGTPTAMSPEQALGKPVDERSDIFSFGSLLHEMATGRPPFARETLVETVNAVIHEAPEDLGRLRADLPADFLDIVRKAMRKPPAERYQHMSDLVADLRHFKRSTESGLVPPGGSTSSSSRRRSAVILGLAVLALATTWMLWSALSGDGDGGGGAPVEGGASAARDRSVAVLPFTTLSTSEEDRIFVSGLHDDVLTQVAKIGALKVISRTSVLEYTNTTKSVPEIGADLGVGAVLEGGVQRAGDAVRINFKLIDAETEENLWAESYNRELTVENVFAIQSEVATEIARVLEATLSAEEKEQIAARPTENMAAYEQYLRGTVFLRESESESYERAARLFQQAIDLDPDFALAHAKLGEAIARVNWAGSNDPTIHERALASVARALELEPGLPAAHRIRGSIYYMLREYERALEEYEIVARSTPNDAGLLLSQGSLLRRTGSWEEARDIVQRTLALDPLHPTLPWEYGTTLLFLGEVEAARAQYERALELVPDNEMVRAFDAIAVLRTRGAELPAGWTERAMSLQTDEFAAAIVWGILLKTRDYEKVLRFLEMNPDRAVSQWYDRPNVLMRAITHDLAGDHDLARREYEAALALLEAEPTPDMRTYASLGLVYAGLDRAQEALEAGRLSLELMPYAKDSIVNPALRLDHAFAMARVGELERAVDEIRTYLSKPSLYNIECLLHEPRLDPLRELESFQALVADERGRAGS